MLIALAFASSYREIQITL